MKYIPAVINIGGLNPSPIGYDAIILQHIVLYCSTLYDFIFYGIHLFLWVHILLNTIYTCFDYTTSDIFRQSFCKIKAVNKILTAFICFKVFYLIPDTTKLKSPLIPRF